MGSFLRINTLKKENIKNQLFYFSKESLKHIVLSSRCGIILPYKELKTKNIPNLDNNTFKSISPLLCIYRKGDPKLITHDNSIHWNEEKLKKEIDIFGNALMTLCLLEISDYYNQYRNLDHYYQGLSQVYSSLASQQLDFYAAYLRNCDGVFVDKVDLSDSIIGDFKFEDKDKNFKFSDQAVVMAAFYQYSMRDSSVSEEYSKFSLDILKMLLHFRNDLYSLSSDELCKLCLALNTFYRYSKNEDAKMLLLDLLELLADNYENGTYSYSKKRLDHDCMLYLNCVNFEKNTGLNKFSSTSSRIKNSLINLYNPDLGMFSKHSMEKETEFTCTEIMLYLLCLLTDTESRSEDDKLDSIIKDVYRKQVVNSGIVLSWPEAPETNNSERYRSLSLRSDDILEEDYFRMASIPAPESNELAPVFTKHVLYNMKKDVFKHNRNSFDSTRNLLILYLLITSLKDLDL